MFTLITEDHRLIADTVDKVFEDLAAADAAQRQTGLKPLEAASIAAALVELGLGAGIDADPFMSSALVQAQIAVASGRASLSYPVLEDLLGQALGGLLGRDLAMVGVSTSAPGLRLDAGRIKGVAERVAFAEHRSTVLARAAMWQGEALVLIPATLPGMCATFRATIEPDYPLSDIAVGVAATAGGVEVFHDRTAVRALRLRSDLLAAAEIVGACQRMVTMTREHLSSRTQFGQPLGAYQALKHRLAGAHVQVEASLAALVYAAAASDADDSTAEAQILGVKRFVGAAGKQVADAAMQLHGAIGYTLEYPLHQFMRRAHRLGASFTSGADLDRRLFDQFQNEAAGVADVARP